MATRMQQRRGTAAQWTSADPILAAGEIGYESDTGFFKIGDGANHWSDLSYFKDLGDLAGSFDDYVPLTQKGAANGVATLDADSQIPISQLANIIMSAPETLDTLNEIANEIDGVNGIVQNKINAAVTTVNDTISSSIVTGIDAALGNLIVANSGLTKSFDAETRVLTISADSTLATDTELSSAISDHNSDSTNVHGITDTAALATKTYADSAVDTHNTDTTNVHGIADTAALATKTYADGKASDAQSAAATALSNHEADTTNIHGIADTAALATKTYADSAVSTAVSALTKSSVGLANVDNTSDVNKPVSTATQTALDLKAPKANPTFTGTLTAADVTLSGNLTVSGTTTTVNTANLNITDPMIYMGDGNSANLADLGIVSAFNDGTYQHTGLVRDSSAGTWKLFKGVTDEPTTTVNFSQGSLDALAVGSLSATSIAVGNVSNTEFGYLDGVTSAIQTQIDAKLASATAASTYETITNVALKAPKADPTFTGLTTVSASGIAFTDGTQTKQGVPSITAINQQAGAYTSVLSDRDKLVEVSSASGVTVTIPANASVAYPVGTSIDILQTGTGQVTIAGAGGVTVNATPGLKLRTQWSSATLFKRATDTWVVFGDLTA
jgi:hypothetical protein